LTGLAANCSSKIDRVGRDGLLELSFRRDGSRTALNRCYFAPPLQALEPFYEDDGSLCVMMLNIGGGMVGGDRLKTTVDLSSDTHAVLITASAAKAYRANGPAASQETQIKLGENATLEYFPDHLIPHAGAAVDQTLRIEMAKGSRAIIYDAIAAGRIGRGERWQFRELTSEIIVNRRNSPVYLNRASVRPASQPLDELGWMEDYNYLGTMVIAGEYDHNWVRLTGLLHSAQQDIQGLMGSASVLAGGGCVARFICSTATTLNRTTGLLWGIARRDLIGLEAFVPRKL
jgi:urease accessory protein